MVPLPVDLDRRAIQVEAGQGVAQRCALGGATELRQRLGKSVERLHGLTRLAMLPQHILALLHGVGLSGQEVMVLQGLPGGSPLV